MYLPIILPPAQKKLLPLSFLCRHVIFPRLPGVFTLITASTGRIDKA